MRPGLIIFFILSDVNGFLWAAKFDLKSVMHKLMNDGAEQTPHARKKLVTQVITGIFMLY